MEREKIIVFAGDSTTDSDKLSTVDQIGTGYVKVVRDSLVAFRPWENYRVWNAGVNGHTSRDLLLRWDRDVLSRQPDYVFCMIGINDVWRQFDYLAPSVDLVSLEEYKKNLSEIAQKSAAIQNFYFMTPFFMERNRQDEMLCLAQRYAQGMKEVANEYGRKVLNLQEKFDDYMKSRSGLSICGDRVHPSFVGSLIIARCILQEAFSL